MAETGKGGSEATPIISTNPETRPTMWNRETHRAGGAIAAFVLMSFPTSSWAEVAEIELKDLVARSDLIVVAKVSKVEDGPDHIKPVEARFPPVKVATAEVIERWKGVNVREVRYVASPTRYCDIA